MPVRMKCLDPLPKRFAEKIESKFSGARRDGGSSAGCVTEEQRSHGQFWPILIRDPSEASKSPAPKKDFFRQRFLAMGLNEGFRTAQRRAISARAKRTIKPMNTNGGEGNAIPLTYPKSRASTIPALPASLPCPIDRSGRFLAALAEAEEGQSGQGQTEETKGARFRNSGQGDEAVRTTTVVD